MNIAHVFAHEATNLGDIYLRRATRDAFRTVFPGASFTDVEVRRIFTEADVASLDEHDLVLVGGGGLLLRDTFPNDVSDWQWGCGEELLRRIEAPIVVFAIGYNRFRGQEDFARPLFDRHIELLVRKSAFFSVRNHGSAEALRRYVPPELGHRIRVNHCPSILFPRVVVDRPTGSRRVGLLLAGDRLSRRHPDPIAFGDRVRALVRNLTRVSQLHLVAHQPQDLWYMEQIDASRCEIVDLIGKSPEEAMAFYSGIDVMIGDRGHAQMIPFGLGCRIVSVVSHDKLRWFLDDVGLADHAVEEGDPLLVDKVMGKAFPTRRDDYRDRRAQALRSLSRVTYEHLAAIPDLVRSRAREVELCPA